MMGLHWEMLAGLGTSLGWHGGLAGGSGAAALPAFGLQQWWLPLGWALVLAALVLAALVRWGVIGCSRRGDQADANVPKREVDRTMARWAWGAAAAVMVWCLWPGSLSPSYWLGLAFQAPSSLTVVLACNALWCAWRTPRAQAAPGAAWSWWVLTLLGWVLLLDTFAGWPLSLYGWGFGPQALGWLALVSLMPLVLGGWRTHPAVWAVPVALLLFVALRLPTGNVWDAVLDPWLWLVAQGLVLRQLWRAAKVLLNR